MQQTNKWYHSNKLLKCVFHFRMTNLTDEAQQKFHILVIACKNGGNIFPLPISIQVRVLGVLRQRGWLYCTVQSKPNYAARRLLPQLWIKLERRQAPGTKRSCAPLPPQWRFALFKQSWPQQRPCSPHENGLLVFKLHVLELIVFANIQIC
jgi:hypothetical protein